MFDRGVDYRTEYVNYISKSRKLVEGINYILEEINFKPDYLSLDPDKFGRYKIRFRKKQKLIKCIDLFEQNTEKWFRLKEHLYGLDNKTNDLNIALRYFDLYYPRVRKSSITFSDVIKVVYKLGESDLINVSKCLNRNKTVCYEFLNKLEKWDILVSKRKSLKKIWELNTYINVPRR